MSLRLPFGSSLVVLTVDRLGTTNFTFAAWGHDKNGRHWVLDRIWLSTSSYGRLETVVPVPEGTLEGCAVQHLDSLEVLGDSWVSITLRVVGPGFNEDAAVLASGYCTQFNSVGYPAGGRPNSATNTAAPTEVVIADPAAGSELSFTIPTGHRARILSLTALFVTGAVVGSRRPCIRVDDGVDPLMFVIAATTQAASLTSQWTFAPGLAGVGQPTVGNAFGVSFPDMLPGWRVRTSTVLLDPGDTWTVGRIVLQYLPRFAP